ncbi:MAG: hypothetical protein LQ345_002419 [Seirophora villosa]|nr:MAG: hypothetical protein LQ345_002419 [Seirophora villosa]
MSQRAAGSKWVLLLEEFMVLTVWACKLCMLFLYRHPSCSALFSSPSFGMGYVTNLPAIWTSILDLFPRLSKLAPGMWNTSRSKHGTQSRIARAGRGQYNRLQNSSRWGSTTDTPPAKESEIQEYIDVTFTARKNTSSDEDDLTAAKPGDKAASAGQGGYSTHCNAA